MKLSELSNILCSTKGNAQFGIIFDSKMHADIDEGVIDRLVEDYGDKEVIRIEAFDCQIVVVV